jgi:hypothetical protein
VRFSFSAFDTDDDGVLDAEEFAFMTTVLTKAAAAAASGLAGASSGASAGAGTGAGGSPVAAQTERQKAMAQQRARQQRGSPPGRSSHAVASAPTVHAAAGNGVKGTSGGQEPSGAFSALVGAASASTSTSMDDVSVLPGMVSGSTAYSVSSPLGPQPSGSALPGGGSSGGGSGAERASTASASSVFAASSLPSGESGSTTVAASPTAAGTSGSESSSEGLSLDVSPAPHTLSVAAALAEVAVIFRRRAAARAAEDAELKPLADSPVDAGSAGAPAASSRGGGSQGKLAISLSDYFDITVRYPQTLASLLRMQATLRQETLGEAMWLQLMRLPPPLAAPADAPSSARHQPQLRVAASGSSASSSPASSAVAAPAASAGGAAAATASTLAVPAAAAAASAGLVSSVLNSDAQASSDADLAPSAPSPLTPISSPGS